MTDPDPDAHTVWEEHYSAKPRVWSGRVNTRLAEVVPQLIPGRALDLGSPAAVDLDEDFARTREYRWLTRHAARFGFRLSYPRGNPHGIGFEPWHWCWRRRGV